MRARYGEDHKEEVTRGSSQGMGSHKEEVTRGHVNSVILESIL